MAKFEIGVVNETVAKLVQRGQRHAKFPDAWSDIHYIEVDAPDEKGAVARIGRRYPKDDGFVITDVTLIEE